VAEQGCLLSSYPDKIGIGGSNPPLSATSIFPNINGPISHLRLVQGSGVVGIVRIDRCSDVID
jgi:hypothetical protein